jgi:hypothetical protein
MLGRIAPLASPAGVVQAHTELSRSETDVGRAIHCVAVALPLAIAAGTVEAACQWTHRAGMPYIACDAAPVGLRPPEAVIREPVPAPDVPPAPLPETPAQPPIAGTPAAPLGPGSGWPDGNSPSSALERPGASAPSLNLHPPAGLLNPPGGHGASPTPSLAK